MLRGSGDEGKMGGRKGRQLILNESLPPIRSCTAVQIFSTLLFISTFILFLSQDDPASEG